MSDNTRNPSTEQMHLHDPAGGVDMETQIAKTAKRSNLLPLVLLGIALISLVGMFVVEDKIHIGLLSLALMLMLIAMRLPVAIALLAPALIGLWAIRGWKTTAGALAQLAWNSVASWSFSVVPMFVFIGLLLWRSGLTENLYRAGKDWLGWLPGGLAVGTNFAGAGLAAVSGSSVGTTYALTRIGVPEMLKAGYDRRLAVSSVIVAGLPGQLIPPSILLVIFAGIAEAPIGPQLLAGIGPGILVAIMFGLTFILMVAFRPQLAGGRASRRNLAEVTWGQRGKSLLGTWPVIILIPIIFVGMFSGVFTATEAGAAAAVVAIIVVLLWKRDRGAFGNIGQAAVGTIATTGAIMFMLIGASALSRMLTMSGLSNALAEGIKGLDLGRIEFLLLMMLIYLFMGMFMEPLAMMLLTVPLLIPTLEALDISLLWFGVFVVFLGELAIVTPPVGILAYIVHGLVRQKSVNMGTNVSLKDVFVAVGWMMPVAILIILLLIFFPQIATTIPDFAASLSD